MAGKFEKFNEMNMEQGSWVPCTHFWILDGKESVKKNRKIWNFILFVDTSG